MKPEFVEVNELVQVSVVDDPNSRAYPSRVEDIVGQKVNIAWPTDNGARVPFHQGEKLFLAYLRKDAVYGIEVVVDNTMHSPIPMLVVHSTTGVQRIQRREFVRVAAMLPVELSGKLAPDETSAKGSQVLIIKAHTNDLSGGGLSIQHKSPLPIGAVFETKLTLPGVAPLNLLAKVVRQESKLDAYQSRIFRVGLAFLSINEGARSRIIRYVLEVQSSLAR
jgi:c-di-GMP-binding flagellar brake protein YcgR